MMESKPFSAPSPPSAEHEGKEARGASSLFLLAAVTVVAMGISSARDVILPILFGFLFAAAAQPLVWLCERHKVHPALAVLVGLTAMVMLFLAASGTLVFGTLDLATEASRYEAAIRATQLDLTRTFGSHGFTRLAILTQRQQILTIDEGSVGMLIDFSVKLLGFATLAGLVAFFGLLERASLVRRLTGTSRSQETWSRILSDTQRYLAIKAATSAITGALAALVCLLADLPNPALWGALAFWLNFVPVVGSIMAGIPPIVLALATHSAPTAGLVMLGYLAINMVFGNILEPRWQGKAAGMSPLIVVLAIAIWSGLLGLLGALVAVPLTMIIKIGCFHTKDLSWVARVLGETEPRQKAESLSTTHDEGNRVSLFS
jgi:predicted PurR-regulated permease PerM